MIPRRQRHRVSTAKGTNARFAPTRWSLVARAAGPDDTASRDALNELCRAYWWPLYAYVRRLRKQSEDAADIVQGLVAEIIEKRRLGSADAGKGRFRDWLRTAVEFHLGHSRERASAQKRGGGLRGFDFDEAEAERRWVLVADKEQDPGRLFDRAWALEVLDRALVAVERDYVSRGKAAVFEALKPCLVPGTGATAYASIAPRLKATEGAVKVAAHRLRRDYQAALRHELQATVEDPADADAEFNALKAALGP
jgi:DNA-directed RNA polymerase specialized sigma24 family protein